jgi:hypothetical protein
MAAPIKSYLLKTNLKNQKLSLKLPRDTFVKGIWQINIRQIMFEKSTNSSHFVCISTNFIRGYDVQEGGIKMNYPPLKIFLMKSNPSEKKSVSFDVMWHYINNIESEFFFFLTDLDTEQPLTLDCKVHMLLDIQQVK